MISTVKSEIAIEKELGREVFILYSRQLSLEEYNNVRDLGL